jgi:large subunit ribosomal protein L2
MPSGEMRQVRVECRATIGQVGNTDHANVRIGKAGRKRHMGRRPHNRGTSMNPVAHPLGGGEGRSGGGRHPCSAWGQPAKGGSTRRKRKPSNRRILRRRKSKRYGQLTIPKK